MYHGIMNGEVYRPAEGLFRPYSKEEEFNNKSIAGGIRRVLADSAVFLNMRSIHLKTDDYAGVRSNLPYDSNVIKVGAEYNGINFSLPYDSDNVTRMRVQYRERSLFALIGGAPKELRLPVYSLNFFRTAEPYYRVSTPYGILPEVARGADRVVYRFENHYFFDEEGQVAKGELVTVLFDPFDKHMRDVAFFVSQRNKFSDTVESDILFSSKDSRYVRLDEADYKKIARVLGFIQHNTENKVYYSHGKQE